MEHDQVESQRVNGAGTQARLNNLVINTELTLISIIQGVALYFLTDTARQVLSAGRVELYPYIFTGLLIIFLFWSRSIIHTLTIIRWPLDFGHNFLYIACTLAQALLFTMMTDVVWWYIQATVYSLLVWGLFAFDLRMIHKRLMQHAGEHEQRILEVLRTEQRQMTYYAMPAATVIYAVAAIAVKTYPGFFIQAKGHLWLAAGQLGASVAYLAYVLKFYRRITPMIPTLQQKN